MEKLDIYCFTSKNYKFLDYLPKNIIPVGLGNNDYSKNYLVETSGKNISKFNKYFAELSGIYWVYKNKLSQYNNNDFIGFCHYRRLWLDGLYFKDHKINSDIFSRLLTNKLEIFDNSEVVMLQPTKLKNENIYDHFKNNHGSELMDYAISLLDVKKSEAFKKYLKKNELSICTMFITRPSILRDYCDFIFPFLIKLLDYSLSNNLCVGKNTRLPGFFMERFTSFWFHEYHKVKYLSYAQLGNFFTSNLTNNLYNTLKTPLTFRFYPTFLDI